MRKPRFRFVVRSHMFGVDTSSAVEGWWQTLLTWWRLHRHPEASNVRIERVRCDHMRI